MQTMVTIAQIVYEASVEMISVVIMYLYDKKIYIFIPLSCITFKNRSLLLSVA